MESAEQRRLQQRSAWYSSEIRGYSNSINTGVQTDILVAKWGSAIGSQRSDRSRIVRFSRDGSQTEKRGRHGRGEKGESRGREKEGKAGGRRNRGGASGHSRAFNPANRGAD